MPQRIIRVGEIGRRLTIRNMDEDWVAAGHTAILRVKSPKSGAANDIPMVAVAGDVYACRRVTDGSEFANHDNWQAQVITLLAGVEQWKSDIFVLPIGKNIS